MHSFSPYSAADPPRSGQPMATPVYASSTATSASMLTPVVSSGPSAWPHAAPPLPPTFIHSSAPPASTPVRAASLVPDDSFSIYFPRDPPSPLTSQPLPPSQPQPQTHAQAMPGSRLQVEFAMPHLPGKARKRHKVATSCNRCRQNKRKCDSGVPCSNCKRNNVDCCYTDAQLSRAIWGDSPLSQEKVIGVAANRGSTAQTLAVMPPYALAHGMHPLFYPSHHVSGESFSLNRSRQVLAQSKHISKSLRVAHPGPLYPPASSNPAVSASVPARAPAQLLPKDTLVKSATAPIDQASSTRPTWQQQEQLTRPVLATMQDQSAHRVSPYIDGSGMDSRGHCYPPNTTSQVHYSSSHAEFHRRDSLIPNTSSSSAYHPGYYGSLPFAPATESLPPSSSTQRPAVVTNSPSSADGPTVVGVSPPIPTSAGFVGYSHRATASTSSTTPLTSPMDLLPPIATATAQAHAAFNPSKHAQSLQLPSLQQPQAHSSQPRNGEHASHQRQLSRQSIQDSLPMQPFLADVTSVVAVATAENNSNDISAMVGVAATGTGTGTTMTATSAAVASGTDQCNSFESWNESTMLESPYGEGDGGAYFTGVPRPESSSTHSQLQSSSATSATVFPAPSSRSSMSIDPKGSMSTERNSGRMPTSLGQGHGQGEGQASEASSGAMAIAMDDKMTRATTGREESLLESKRMQKIASEMLAVKKYDMSIMIPRHISQERDEFWIPPPSSSSSSPLSPSSSTSSFSSSSPSSSLQCASGIQGLPNHLLMLPRDANYLVDVFFEHSHFYYPVINRAAVELYLMDPNSPQALLMLNIIFMTACKHLGRASDIKRAVQFRERAREVQFFIEGKVRLSRMQSLLLGSLAVYGVFNVAIGLAQVCGTYNALATTPCSTMPCSTTATVYAGLASSSSGPAASACASASASTNTSGSTSGSTSATPVPTPVPTSAPTSSSSVSALASSSAAALSPSIPLSLSSCADLETEKLTGGTETISTASTTGRASSGKEYLQGPGLGERDQEPEQGQGQGRGRGQGRGQERGQTKDSRGRGRENEYADLESHIPSIQEGQEGVIPEAAYQARLWVFWGFYIRDSIARLYFGWPHGIDSLLVSAELPKIAGCVGLGGRRKLSSEAGTKGGPGSMVASVTGKRRDSMFHRDAHLPEKRRMTSERPDRHGPSAASTHSDGKSISFDRATYRNTRLVDSDDEDDDDDDMDDEDVRRRGVRNSNRRFARRRLLGAFAQDDEDDDGDDVYYRGLVDDDEPADRDRDEQDRLGHLGFRGSIGQESSMQHPHSRGNPNRNRRRLPYRFSAMSPELLEEQSQGHWRAFVPPNQTLDTIPLVSAKGDSSVPRDLLPPYPQHQHHHQQQQHQQQHDSQSPQQDQRYVPLIRKESQGLEEKQQTFDRHMERMRLLLEAEEDVTDGGSYSRFLFLEEVKLWAIGRRVAYYLATRSSNPAPSACPLAGLSGSALASAGNAENASGSEGYEEGCSSNNASTSGASSRSPTWARHVARQWSEQAWIQDQELQSLQADLIEWEKSFPEHLRFREDVDQEGVNHKVNGKMGVLIMSYYTITILLQSSYLPIAGNVTPGSSSTSSVRASPSRTLDPTARSSKRHSAESVSQCDSPSQEASSTAHTQDCQESPIQSPSQDPLGPAHRPWSPPLSFKSRGHSICPRYFNTAHEISSTLSNVLLHHVELMLDSYPNWCSFQAKVNHSLVAALRVSCLNAKLSHNSSYEREEAKAGFKMGSDLFKRLALLPAPLTIRDWPAEEDVQQMLDIEEEFRDMMMTQEEQVEAEAEELAEEGEAGVASGTMDGSGTVPEDVGNDESWSSASMGANLPIFGDLEDEGFKFECDQPLSKS